MSGTNLRLGDPSSLVGLVSAMVKQHNTLEARSEQYSTKQARTEAVATIIQQANLLANPGETVK